MKIETVIQQLEILVLTAENNLMKKLSTRKGFFEHYFNLLSKARSKEQAFNQTNDLYYKLFKVKRFENYLEFKNRVYNC